MNAFYSFEIHTIYEYVHVETCCVTEQYRRIILRTFLTIHLCLTKEERDMNFDEKWK